MLTESQCIENVQCSLGRYRGSLQKDVWLSLWKVAFPEEAMEVTFLRRNVTFLEEVAF